MSLPHKPEPEHISAAEMRFTNFGDPLEEQKFILHQTQKLSKTGSWNFDKRTGNTAWSDEMFNIHGLDKDFDTNDYNAVLQLYEDPSRRLFLEAAQVLFERGTPFDITARIITPLGYIKWVRVVGHPLIESEEIVGIVGITADITAHREAEQMLRASEEKFEKTFRNSPDPMVLMREQDMLIVDVNEKILPLLGYTPDELIGKPSPGEKLYNNPADRDKFLSTYFHQGMAEIECGWRKKDGEVIDVLLHSCRIEIKGQYYFLTVIKDITDRKLLETQSKTLIQRLRKDRLPVRLERLIEQMEVNSDSPASKLVLPTAEGLIFIRPREIIYCEAQSNYTQLHLTDSRKQMVSKTLKDFETLLPCEFFFRIHNSYIINMSFIKKYNKGEGMVTMENDTTLDVSKRKKESFLKRIGADRSQSGQLV